jgi:hypothetical protein
MKISVAFIIHRMMDTTQRHDGTMNNFQDYEKVAPKRYDKIVRNKAEDDVWQERLLSNVSAFTTNMIPRTFHLSLAT